MVLVWFWYVVGMVWILFWYDFDMAFVWFGNGVGILFGIVLLWFWYTIPNNSGS